MKFISITKSINIRPDWATIGARLKAGTPLDITGAVANSSAAVGILADDAEKSSAEVAVVTEGSIDLAEITASYGELEDDCIAAIKGIAFIGSDGNPIVPSGGGLPDYSEASDGDVLSIDNGAPAWTSGGADRFIVTLTPTGLDFSGTMDKTVAEIYEAYLQGKDIWFTINAMGWNLNIRVGEVNLQGGFDYPSINTDTLIGPEITGIGYALLHAGTGSTNNGTQNTYNTIIFPLASA